MIYNPKDGQTWKAYYKASCKNTYQMWISTQGPWPADWDKCYEDDF